MISLQPWRTVPPDTLANTPIALKNINKRSLSFCPCLQKIYNIYISICTYTKKQLY